MVEQGPFKGSVRLRRLYKVGYRGYVASRSRVEKGEDIRPTWGLFEGVISYKGCTVHGGRGEHTLLRIQQPHCKCRERILAMLGT